MLIKEEYLLKPTKMKKKFALYVRVSTHLQTNDSQKDVLISHAKNQGWNYDLFEEVESSRKTRPIKVNLLKALRAGEYDGVVVYKLDRWARSSTELLLEIDELNKKEIDFISISDNLDFSTASGKLHFAILSAFCEFERSIISERTKIALARKKAEGIILGRPVGSKDKRKRKTDGYLIREHKKREERYLVRKAS